MTDMFLQCGLLIEVDVIEMEHYQGRNATLLKSAVWMSLVIMSFRTTFSMKGSHNTNPYFKNLPSVVRRSVHVIVTRYMEQECTWLNHVQCDVYPTTPTSEVVLPSYQHFLQYIHQTGMTKKVSNESDALKQYGKTMHMLILARVNGYYSPYSPQTIMEEEAKCRYRDVFTLAEREFFKQTGNFISQDLRWRYGNLHHLFRTTEASQLPMLCSYRTERIWLDCLQETNWQDWLDCLQETIWQDALWL